jgi:hypothetical protein
MFDFSESENDTLCGIEGVCIPRKARTTYNLEQIDYFFPSPPNLIRKSIFNSSKKLINQ